MTLVRSLVSITAVGGLAVHVWWWFHRRRRPNLPIPSVASPPLAAAATALTGRVFIVTGGARGVGEGVALALAARGAAGITIVDRDAPASGRVQRILEAEPYCCRTLVVCADLSKAEECKRVIKEHDAAFQRVDGLVNCAATTARGSWQATSPKLFDMIMALNVRAPFMLMQGVSELIERDDTEARGGSIVNIGSIHTHGGMPKLVAYAASKAALLAITKNFAFAKRHHRIRANYIALGWTATPTEHETMLAEGQPSDWLSRVADPSHPFGRIYRPADVGHLVAYLMSDAAKMQTGTCIDLHEGFFGTWE